MTSQVRTGFVLWGLAIVLWVLLTYTIFAAFTVKEEKPPLERQTQRGSPTSVEWHDRNP